MSSTNPPFEFDPESVMRGDVPRLQRLARRDPEQAQTRVEQSQAALLARSAWQPHISIPDVLPIAAQAPSILAALKANQVIVVAGETGSGKTTQLPKICLQAGLGYRGLIGHTQPRRLAARTVATRIAEELDVELGQQIGYSVRFSDQSGPQTLVKVMTDGLLLAEIPSDRWLNKYDVLIIDEAHERSLNIDFLLGYLRELLERRKDLKLIITSATIDVGAFSRHFFDAPVIQVSGRGFPVAIEYRESQGERVLLGEAVADCLDEIAGRRSQGARDTLVFLPGEREIFDLAGFLRKRMGEQWEILPLYARLPASEQQRVFRPGPKRRVVLATNVAETSITVPNIGYVIDAGTARISRYSYRSKLQRLPIEAVSQASAQQRSGRCGRISPGVCYRLYAQSDFDGRPAYTDPEIKRTNLAAVLLQMQAFGLGDIDRFPFLEAPDPAAVRAARRLLEELGAIADNKVTVLGRQMARLPIDPRLARMLLEANRQGALTEVLIIASGLAVADPRERPRDKQAAADAAHEAFTHSKSEFMSWLKLWRWADEERASLTRRRYERKLQQAFLSPNRMREWRALHRQLLLACREQKLRLNDKAADYANIHLSLLSGSLSFVGLHDERGRYLGARNLNFRIFPGSSLAAGPGGAKAKWIMAAEIVETSAVYARSVATIDPRWVETQAAHLLKRDLSEPHWSLKRGEVMAYEKTSLYGLVLSERRLVSFARQDPVIARELFLREGLAFGQLGDKARRQLGFIAHNEALKQELLDKESKSRRRDLLIADDEQTELYAARVPNGIVDVRGLLQWLRRDPNNDSRLRFTLADLQRNLAPDLDDYPAELNFAETKLPLRYRFAPGEIDDGVSLRVPLGLLNSLVPELLEWSVPGLFPLVAEQWLRGLPKLKRKHLAPVPDKIPDLMERLLKPALFRQGRMLSALSAAVADLYDVEVLAKDWDPARLETYLRMNVQVLDEQGKMLAQDRDLVALQARFKAQVVAQVEAGLPATYERDGMAEFPLDLAIPKRKVLAGDRVQAMGYPGLVDQGETVGLKVFADEHAAYASNRDGYARMALLDHRRVIRQLRSQVRDQRQLNLHYAPLGRFADLEEDLVLGVSWFVFFEGRELPEQAQEFSERMAECGPELVPRFRQMLEQVALIYAARFELVQLMATLSSPAYAPAVEDARAQVDQLVPASLLRHTPSAYVTEIPRYLAALGHRLENLQGKIGKDTEHLKVIQSFVIRMAKIEDSGLLDSSRLGSLRFAIEELRVALFAERLKRGKISVKRLGAKFLQVEQETGLA